MSAFQGTGAFVFVLLASAACSEGDVRGAEQDVRRGAGEARDELSDVWAELKARTAEGRSDLERELGELKGDIDDDLGELERESRDATSSLRGDLDRELGELRRSAGELDERLAALRAAGADEWSELRDGVVDRMRSLRERLEDALRRARG